MEKKWWSVSFIGPIDPSHAHKIALPIQCNDSFIYDSSTVFDSLPNVTSNTCSMASFSACGKKTGPMPANSVNLGVEHGTKRPSRYSFHWLNPKSKTYKGLPISMTSCTPQPVPPIARFYLR